MAINGDIAATKLSGMKLLQLWKVETYILGASVIFTFLYLFTRRIGVDLFPLTFAQKI